MWHTLRLQCLLRLDLPRAEQEARARVQDDPGAVDYLYLLGEALRLQGDPGAKACYEGVLELEPDSPWARLAGRKLEQLER